MTKKVYKQNYFPVITKNSKLRTRISCNLLTGKSDHILLDHISNSPNILLLF